MKDLPDVVLALGGLGLALFCPPAFALPTGPRLCASAAEASFVPVGLEEHRGGIPGVSHFSSFSALGFVHRFVRSISVSSLPRSIGLDLWMASRFVRVSIPGGGRAFSRSLSIGSGSDVSMHVFVRSDAGDVSFRVRCLWVRVRFFDVRGGVSLLRSFQVRSHRRPTRGRFVRQRLRFRRHESSTARHGSFVSFLLGNRSRTSFLCVLLPRFVHTSSNGSVGSRRRRRRRRCFFFFFAALYALWCRLSRCGGVGSSRVLRSALPFDGFVFVSRGSVFFFPRSSCLVRVVSFALSRITYDRAAGGWLG